MSFYERIKNKVLGKKHDPRTKEQVVADMRRTSVYQPTTQSSRAQTPYQYDTHSQLSYLNNQLNPISPMYIGNSSRSSSSCDSSSSYSSSDSSSSCSSYSGSSSGGGCD